MLVSKISRVQSRTGVDQASFVLDLLDDRTPQGRSMNFRVSVSWEGLFALKEAIDLITSRETDVATGQEKPTKTHKFVVAKNVKKVLNRKEFDE